MHQTKSDWCVRHNLINTSDNVLHSGDWGCQIDYDGNGTGKGGLATIFVDGKEVANGRIDKTQPAVFSADETADVGLDDATQVADKVFKDLDDSKFTGFVKNVTISIPE